MDGYCGSATASLPAKSSLNQSVISDDDPLTTWADPNREPEAGKEEIVTSLTRIQGDHDEQRKVELVQKSPNGYAGLATVLVWLQQPLTLTPGPHASSRLRVEENIQRYNRWLRRAKTDSFADLAARNMMYTSGTWVRCRGAHGLPA